MFETLKNKKNIALYGRLIGRQGKRLPNAVFSHVIRCRLLGATNLPGRDTPQSINDLWYDVRTKVKTALIDLLLFLDVTSKNNVNQVITKESLNPIVEALFHESPDVNRAEIAQLFITTAFRYLESNQSKDVTLSHQRTITEALDLCNYLVDSFKPESERRHRTPRMRPI